MQRPQLQFYYFQPLPQRQQHECRVHGRQQGPQNENVYRLQRLHREYRQQNHWHRLNSIASNFTTINPHILL